MEHASVGARGPAEAPYGDGGTSPVDGSSSSEPLKTIRSQPTRDTASSSSTLAARFGLQRWDDRLQRAIAPDHAGEMDHDIRAYRGDDVGRGPRLGEITRQPSHSAFVRSWIAAERNHLGITRSRLSTWLPMSPLAPVTKTRAPESDGLVSCVTECMLDAADLAERQSSHARKTRSTPAVDAAAMDLDVVIVSHRDERWLQPCVQSLAAPPAHAITARRSWRTADPRSPSLRAPSCACSTWTTWGSPLRTTSAPGSGADFLLFLNPDTELVEGTLELLVESMRARPEVGLLGTRQVADDGELWPSLHRFPSVPRAFAQALANERWPLLGKRLGERVLDPAPYARRDPFDWTTGAVLAVRREALRPSGGSTRTSSSSRRKRTSASGSRTWAGRRGSSRGSRSFITPARRESIRPERHNGLRPPSVRPKAFQPTARCRLQGDSRGTSRGSLHRPALSRLHPIVERSRFILGDQGAARLVGPSVWTQRGRPRFRR